MGTGIVAAMKRVALLLAAVLLAACAKKSAPDPQTPPGSSPYDERQACSIDADCIVVEIECCDHCNGGTVVGIQRDYVNDIRASYVPDSKCKDAACTKMACVEEPVAICRQGICGLRTGEREDVPALPPL